MLDVLLALALVVLIGVFVVALQPEPDDVDDADRAPRASRRPRQVPWVALCVGLLTATVLLVAGLSLMIVVSVAVLIGIGCHVIVRVLTTRKELNFELALAAGLDLVVASLRAGAALVESLGTAADETRGNVSLLFGELCDRVRLGEAASEVLDDLAERYPQEGVRLFAFTLASHFDSGGSAATSLGEVSRSIRDRVDVVRRANSQSVETQASVVGILVITYGLALLMNFQYPERVRDFAANDLGRTLIGFSIVLQAIGLAWISRMTRVEV